MILDLMNDDGREMPVPDDAAQIRAVRIWHCKYRSLSALNAFKLVQTLVVASFPDPDLTPLAQLSELEHLTLLHLPKIHDLSPLASLTRLKTVRLHTTPGWDSSGKRTVVDSLAPLARIHRQVIS